MLYGVRQKCARRTALAVAVAITVLALAARAQVTYKNLIEVTDHNYEVYRKSQQTLVVAFIDDHRRCEKYLGELDAVAEMFKGDEEVEALGLHFGYINTTQHKYMMNVLNVTHFPTTYLLQYHGSRRDKYTNFNDRAYVKRWLDNVLKQPPVPSREINTIEQLREKIQDSQDLTMFFGTSRQTAEFQVFSQLARKTPQKSFAHTFSEEIKKEERLNPSGQYLVVYNNENQKNGLPPYFDFNGDLTNLDEVEEFHYVQTKNMLTKMNPYKLGTLEKLETPILMIAFPFSNNFQDQRTVDFLSLRKQAFDENVLLGIIDTNHAPLLEHVKKTYKVEETDLPLLIYYELKPIMRKPRQLTQPARQGQFPREEMQKFVKRALAGEKDTRKLKSEPEVPQDKNALVKDVVSDSFIKLVVNNPKHVVVYFFKHDSPECMKFESTFQDAALELRDNKEVEFMRFNTALNELEEYEFPYVPAVMIFPKHQKTGVTVFVQQDVDAFVKDIEGGLIDYRQKQNDEQQQQEDNTETGEGKKRQPTKQEVFEAQKQKIKHPEREHVDL